MLTVICGRVAASHIATALAIRTITMISPQPVGALTWPIFHALFVSSERR